MSMANHKHSEETRERIRASVRAAHARCPRRLSAEVKERIRASVRAAYVEGRLVAPVFTPEQIKKGSEVKKDRPMVKPGSRRGEDHHTGLTGWLVAPRGAHFYVKNVAHFVREHPELFDPADIVWVSKPGYPLRVNCRAANSLRKVVTRKLAGWKGWHTPI